MQLKRDIKKTLCHGDFLLQSVEPLVLGNLDQGEGGGGKDEAEERGQWSGKLDFLLSCLGYAVGKILHLANSNG